MDVVGGVKPSQDQIFEQQSTELEVLESIFADDLIRIPPPHAWGNTWHPTEFVIVLRPHYEALRSNVSAVLRVRFTKTYPWSKPDIHVLSSLPPALSHHAGLIKGLDGRALAQLNARLHAQLANLPLGQEMVFELVSAAQDYISEHHSVAEVQMRHPQLESLSQFMHVRTAEQLEQSEQLEAQERLEQEQQELERRKDLAQRIAQQQRRTSSNPSLLSPTTLTATPSTATSTAPSSSTINLPTLPTPIPQPDSMESTLHAGTHMVSMHARQESFLEVLSYRDVQTHAVQVGAAIESNALFTTYHVTPVLLGGSTPRPLYPPRTRGTNAEAGGFAASAIYRAPDAEPDPYTWDLREYIISSPYYTANPNGKKALEAVEAQLDTLKSIHSPYLLNVVASSLTRRAHDHLTLASKNQHEPPPWQLIVVSERADLTCASAGRGGVTTLTTLLDLAGPLPWTRVRPLALSLLRAIDALHSRDVVHGAVRPELCWIAKREMGSELEDEHSNAWANVRLDTPTFRAKLDAMNQQHPFQLPTEAEAGQMIQPANRQRDKQQTRDSWVPTDVLALSRSQDLYSLGILLCKALFGLDVTRGYDSPISLLLRPPGMGLAIAPEVGSWLLGLLHEHPRKRPSAKKALSQLEELHTLSAPLSSAHDWVQPLPDPTRPMPMPMPMPIQPASNLAWGLSPSLVPPPKGKNKEIAPLSTSPQTRPGAFWPMMRAPPTRSISPPPATRPVSRYESDFEELQFLGKGAFGSVVRARNILDGRQYAIKKIRLSNVPLLRHDRTFFNRRNLEDDKTLREVQALSRLNHPKVIRYVTCWIEDQVVAFHEESSTIPSSSEVSMDSVDVSPVPGAGFGASARGRLPMRVDTFTSSRSLPRAATSERRLPSTSHARDDESDFLSVGRDAYSRGASAASDDIQFGWDDVSESAKPPASITERSDESESESDPNSDSDSNDELEDSDDDEGDSSDSSRGLWAKPYHPLRGQKGQRRSSDATSSRTASPSQSQALVPSQRDDSLLGLAPNFTGIEEEPSSSVEKNKPRMMTRRTLFIQMEFISGPTLRSVIDDGLTREESWALLRQMLEALTHINLTMGIIHRDLKPSNVFMDADRKIKVGDFGLATTTTSQFPDEDPGETSESGDQQDDDATDLTTDVGTNLYIAPEVERGGSYNAKVDMYSLGVMFFEMLASAGQVYKTGMERVLTIKALREHLKLPPAWPFAPEEPETRVVRWLLQHSPDARPTPLQLLRSKLLPDEDLEDEFVEEFLRMGTNPQSIHHDRLLATLFDGQLFGPDTGQGRTMDEEVNDMARDTKYDDNAGRETEPPLYNLVADSLRTIFRRHGAVQTSVPPLLPPNEFYNPPGSFNHIHKQPLLPSSVGLDTSLVGTDLVGPAATAQGTVHNKLVRLLDRGGRLVYLPYDNILPFARMFMQSRQHPRYKRYDIRGVYRTNPEPTRQPVEVAEANFDIISPVRWAGAEAEVFSVLQAILEQIPGLSKGAVASSGWTIQLNHCSILEAVLKSILSTQDAIHRQAVLTTLGPTLGMRLRQTDRARVRARLKQLGLTTSVIEELERLNVSTSVDEVERKLEEHMPKSVRRDLVGPLYELRQIEQLSQAFGVRLPLQITPLLARNVAYFKSGSIFQLARSSNRRLEVLAAGGRYDGLLTRFAPNERFLHLDPLSATLRHDTGTPEHGVGVEISVGKIALELQNWQEVHVNHWASRASEEDRSFGAWTARRCDVYVISPPGAVLARVALVRDLWAAGIAADLKYDAAPRSGGASVPDDEGDTYDVDPTTGHYSPERILRTCKAEGIGFLVHVRSRGDVVKIRNVLHKTEIEVERDDLIPTLLHMMARQRTTDLATVNSSAVAQQDSLPASLSLAGSVASGSLSGLGGVNGLGTTAPTTGPVTQVHETRTDQVDTHVIFPPGSAARSQGQGGRESRHKERRLQRQGRASLEDKAARDAVQVLEHVVKGHVPVLVIDLPWHDLARIALQEEFPQLEREAPRGAAAEYAKFIRTRLNELRSRLQRTQPDGPHKVLFYSTRDERCLLV